MADSVLLRRERPPRLVNLLNVCYHVKISFLTDKSKRDALDSVAAAMDRPGRLKTTRELIVPGLPYVIRYRIKKATVEILRIHHMVQRWPEEG